MPTFCAHLGYMFVDQPLELRFKAAANCGFRVIEHPAPYGFGVDAFAAATRHHGLSIAQIAAPAGDVASGEKGLACLTGRQDDFRRSVELGIMAAQILKTKKIHIMPGVLPAGATRESLMPLYLDNLAWAADRAAEADLTVLVEAISDETVSGFYVNHPLFALDLLAQLNKPNAALLFDTYHAAVKGLDPIAFVEAHLRTIAHIQVADYPGRHEPGTGTIDFRHLFNHLDALGYDGAVGGEYTPLTTTEAGLSWTRELVDA